jgi:hypothetical protein
MGILDNRHLFIPENLQEPAALVFVLIMTFYLTNVTLDIAWVRFRWRYFMMASKFAGMIGALYFAVWPNMLCLFCLGLSVLNGFADPRLHIPSIQRNKSPPARKWFFAMTQLFHHGGSAMLIVDLLKPLVLDPTASSFSVDVPIIGACMAEIASWMCDTKVLMRTAPRWFDTLHNVLTVIQVSCIVSIYLWFDLGICPATLFTSVIGSAGWLLSSMMGFKASTYETEEAVEGRFTASIARAYYKNNLPTVDPSVMLPKAAKCCENV